MNCMILQNLQENCLMKYDISNIHLSISLPYQMYIKTCIIDFQMFWLNDFQSLHVFSACKLLIHRYCKSFWLNLEIISDHFEMLK